MTRVLNPDEELLVEAYRYGQFSDSMLDHLSPSCHAPCKGIRQALATITSPPALPVAM
jgi:hypothetical protein